MLPCLPLWELIARRLGGLETHFAKTSCAVVPEAEQVPEAQYPGLEMVMFPSGGLLGSQ